MASTVSVCGASVSTVARDGLQWWRRCHGLHGLQFLGGLVRLGLSAGLQWCLLLGVAGLHGAGASVMVQKALATASAFTGGRCLGLLGGGLGGVPRSPLVCHVWRCVGVVCGLRRGSFAWLVPPRPPVPRWRCVPVASSVAVCLLGCAFTGGRCVAVPSLGWFRPRPPVSRWRCLGHGGGGGATASMVSVCCWCPRRVSHTVCGGAAILTTYMTGAKLEAGQCRPPW